MRHVEFLDAEIAAVERLIARDALGSLDARRLMTVPGVNVICAATFLAAIGDIRRFRVLSDVLCEVGVTEAALRAGKAIHDQAEDQVQSE
jgi:transposase